MSSFDSCLQAELRRICQVLGADTALYPTVLYVDRMVCEGYATGDDAFPRPNPDYSSAEDSSSHKPCSMRIPEYDSSEEGRTLIRAENNRRTKPRLHV